MIKKITIAIVTIILLATACKKDKNPNIDPRITAHYLFKPGTYWVFSDYANYTDSMYVTANGTKNGLPYMQINETIKNFNTDTLCSSFTTYIGAGPKATQLQQWNYDLINHTTASQVIFDLDTPGTGAGSYVDPAATCMYTGTGIKDTTMNGVTFYGSLATGYEITYNELNVNQYYGVTALVFYPNFGILEKYCINSPLGNLALSPAHYHIIQ